jgi:hypothetical protein
MQSQSVNPNNANIQYGDSIDQLPVDKSHPSHDEIQLVNTLFENNKNDINSIINELRGTVVIALLFIIMSVPYTDTILQKYIPYTKTSSYALVITKSIIFGALYWILTYFYLSRQDTS